MLEEEVRSSQPTVSNMTRHYEQLQPYLSPIGANDVSQQHADLNKNWAQIKDKVTQVYTIESLRGHRHVNLQFLGMF